METPKIYQPMPGQGFEANETIQLIDGNFEAEDAKEVLLNLIDFKINFHKLKNLSWEIHYGEPNEHSEWRLNLLRKDRDRLLATLEFAMEHGLNINVQSKVEIQLTK